jgi:hypothetical protein
MKTAYLLADHTGQPCYLETTTERRLVSQDQLPGREPEHEKRTNRR